MKNPNCDNDKCWSMDGEIRVLPTGPDSSALLCRTCFQVELEFRKSRNKELGTAFQFKLPAWTDLEVYET